MSSFSSYRLLAAGLCLMMSLVAIGPMGCTSQEEQQAQEQEDSNLTLLKNLIGQYQGRHRGQLPANEQAFRSYIEEHGQHMLNRSGVTTVDDLFTSERDGKPFVVVYQGQRGNIDPKVVAYEQEGKDGVIMWTDGMVVYPEKEEDFRKMVPK